MKITVKIVGPFVYSAGFSEKEMELFDSATVENLISCIKIDRSLSKMILRNGKPVNLDDALTHGDRIVISPIYSGG